jgi:hypothetical protein
MTEGPMILSSPTPTSRPSSDTPTEGSERETEQPTLSSTSPEIPTSSSEFQTSATASPIAEPTNSFLTPNSSTSSPTRGPASSPAISSTWGATRTGNINYIRDGNDVRRFPTSGPTLAPTSRGPDSGQGSLGAGGLRTRPTTSGPTNTGPASDLKTISSMSDPDSILIGLGTDDQRSILRSPTSDLTRVQPATRKIAHQ